MSPGPLRTGTQHDMQQLSAFISRGTPTVRSLLEASNELIAALNWQVGHVARERNMSRGRQRNLLKGGGVAGE